MSLDTAFNLYIGITVFIWIVILLAMKVKPESAGFVICRVIPAVVVIDGIVGTIFLWLRVKAYL